MPLIKTLIAGREHYCSRSVACVPKRQCKTFPESWRCRLDNQFSAAVKSDNDERLVCRTALPLFRRFVMANAEQTRQTNGNKQERRLTKLAGKTPGYLAGTTGGDFSVGLKGAPYFRADISRDGALESNVSLPKVCARCLESPFDYSGG